MSTRQQTAQHKKDFLAKFKTRGNVTTAAAAAGVDRTAVYKWKEKDVSFASAFTEAEIESTEVLEAEAWRRAFNGSDLLLIFLLKARAPSKYRERYEFSGDQSAPLRIIIDQPPSSP